MRKNRSGFTKKWIDRLGDVVRLDVTVHGRLGTGPFFGQKTFFSGKPLAENMDLFPSVA